MSEDRDRPHRTPELPETQADMPSAQELLEHVLAGLRDVEPSTGLSQRVLAGLAARETARQRHVLQPAWMLAALAGGAGLVFWLCFAAGFRPWGRPAQSPVRIPAAFASAPLDSIHHEPFRTATSTGNNTAPQQSAQTAEVVRRQHKFRVEETGVAVMHFKPDTLPGDPAYLSEARADEIAREETAAPSQAAPERPLTAQERMMLRLIRRGDPVELAELDPETRAALLSQEGKDFQNFFEKHSTDGDPQ